MRRQRQPLTPIAANRQSIKELTPYKRAQIEGARAVGASWGQISDSLKIPRSTAQSTISLAPLRSNALSQPRIGRPVIYNDRDERKILRLVRLRPKITYAQLRFETGLVFAKDTFRRILLKYGIKNWIAKKRPLLTPENASTRYRWCDNRKEWSTDLWSTVIFSDECSLERGSGKRPEWCFRTPLQKWDKEMITPYLKGRDLSVMI